MTYRYINEWDDLVVAPVSVNLVGLSSPPVYNEIWSTLDFAGNAVNTIHLTYQMPHGYYCGSNVHFHIHWQPSADGTETSDWSYKWLWCNNGEIDPGKEAWNSGTMQITGDGLARVLQTDEMIVLEKSDCQISSIIQIELQRDGNTDAYSGDVQIVSLDCHYIRDTMGSRSEYMK